MNPGPLISSDNKLIEDLECKRSIYFYLSELNLNQIQIRFLKTLPSILIEPYLPFLHILLLAIQQHYFAAFISMQLKFELNKELHYIYFLHY